MMKLFRIVIILTILLIGVSCNSNKTNEKVLEGLLKVEKVDSEYFLYNNDKKASGILKGKDTILGLSYDIYYLNGRPTGKIIYFNENHKMIEIDMNINYRDLKGNGSIKIYEDNGSKVLIEGMQYLNVISKLENFIDLKNARPTLKWYLENPTNIFEQVDIISSGKKISSIKDEKYYFYDEDGVAFEIPLLKENEIGDNDLIYAEEAEKILIDESNLEISFIKNKESINKLKIGEILGTGIFKINDDNDNFYTLEYNLGIPSGNFEIDSFINGGFKIFGNGQYSISNDIWQGEILIVFEDGNNIKITNAKIKGENLFLEKNIIDFSWINLAPTEKEPLDLNNVFKIIQANIYFNQKNVGEILEGQYKKFK